MISNINVGNNNFMNNKKCLRHFIEKPVKFIVLWIFIIKDHFIAHVWIFACKCIWCLFQYVSIISYIFIANETTWLSFLWLQASPQYTQNIQFLIKRYMRQNNFKFISKIWIHLGHTCFTPVNANVVKSFAT